MLTDNPHYVAYARSIRELHRLILQGRGESAEADEVRDESDEHWRHLSLEEIDHLQSLSADLYTLGEAQPSSTILNSDAFGDLQQSIATGDFNTAMTILRRPDVKPEATLGAFVRASYWFGLGDYESALPFLDEAVRLNPEHLSFRLTRLFCLWLIGDGRVFDEANRLIGDSQITDPDDVIEVSTILALSAYDRARSRNDSAGEFGSDERRAIYRVIRVLQNIMTNASDSQEQTVPQLESLAHEILGLCHGLLAGFSSSLATTDRQDGTDQSRSRSLLLLSQMADLAKLHCKQVFEERFRRSAA